jgi:hypothetical protein
MVSNLYALEHQQDKQKKNRQEIENAEQKKSMCQQQACL